MFDPLITPLIAGFEKLKDNKSLDELFGAELTVTITK